MANNAPTTELLLNILGIQREEVFFFQPGQDQIETVFPDMQGMTARILNINHVLAQGRRYIIIPFHCHPFGGGMAPKTKLYSLRSGSCRVVVFRDGKFEIAVLSKVCDKARVNPGEWHAMVFDALDTSVDVTLSAKDAVPPCWTKELDGLLASNPTSA